MSEPRAHYQGKLDERRARVAALEERSKRIANARLVCFLAAAAVAYFAVVRAIPPGWLAVPVLAFAALVIWHDRALRAQKRAMRAVAFYEHGLARIEDRWAGEGPTGERFMDSQHPFADDLDLFGEGSLFQLLCTARTAGGEELLAGWLKEPSSAAEARGRQVEVAALRDRVQLREDLAVLGDDVRSEIDPGRLRAWGEAEVEALPGWARPAAAGLAALAILAIAGWAWLDWGPLPLLVLVAVEYAMARLLRGRIEQAVAAVDRAGTDLGLLAELLARIEREDLPPGLRALLGEGEASASKQIGELQKRVTLFEARYNQFFIPIGWLLLWDVQCAGAIGSWRRRCGRNLGGWMRAVAQLEALCALAAYAFEHPADPFPELLEAGATFDGEQLGHPLIPDARCVRNDVDLREGKRLILVSGSNMSGKSTYLRTVGINAVLALAGAPVRARRLTLSAVRLGATLRIQDSLQQGASRFYAEITRLEKLLLLSAGDRPLLFLLDEVLHGTNSHDRLIGAEAVIRALLDRGALGLVTTHDLALANLVEALGPLASNAHFADTVQDGKLVFDYRRHEGVVQQSNAIALMRAVGLPV